jgi:hypothetical protein
MKKRADMRGIGFFKFPFFPFAALHLTAWERKAP